MPVNMMVVAIIAICGGIASPAVADTVAGEGIGPDSALHGFEKMGEGLKVAIGVTNNTEIIQERIRELEKLSEEKKYHIHNQIQEINRLMEENQNNIPDDTYQQMKNARNRAMEQKGIPTSNT